LNLQNILVAVVRYFGGTLLGVSGLINAYKETAAITLNGALILEKQITVSFKLNVDYIKMGEVMKWIKDSKYFYSTPIMADTFIVNIEVPYSKHKVMNDFFMEKGWMESS
jgi:putative IMPACT (imprinted ancient) family translation regulator